MSKFTLDDAIKHCLEVAEQNEKKAEYRPRMDYYDEIESRTDCLECAADHRQLAEWLTELKQWHRVYGVCPSYEMCIPECKEGYNAQIAEYKRLLKSAIDEWHIVCEWGDCSEHCEWYVNGQCSQEWSNKAEALKLIGDEPNGI